MKKYIASGTYKHDLTKLIVRLIKNLFFQTIFSFIFVRK